MEKNIKISNERFFELSDTIKKMKLELKSIKPISDEYYVTVKIGCCNIKELIKNTNRDVSISLFKGSYMISSDSMTEISEFLIENNIDNYKNGNNHISHFHYPEEYWETLEWIKKFIESRTNWNSCGYSFIQKFNGFNGFNGNQNVNESENQTNDSYYKEQLEILKNEFDLVYKDLLDK